MFKGNRAVYFLLVAITFPRAKGILPHSAQISIFSHVQATNKCYKKYTYLTVFFPNKMNNTDFTPYCHKIYL